LHAPPTWKVSEERMATARAILERYDGPGPILVRQGVMAEIAIVTVEPKAVNARSLYLIRTNQPERLTKQRLRLTAFVMREGSLPPEPLVRHALADFEVGLVCLEEADPQFAARRAVLGGVYRESFGTDGYRCFVRRPSGSG
jgi:hypothetical protein